jgi:RNA polymerase sigma factor (sigma-70 family)
MFAITQQQFDSLLSWLAPDRDFAGKKYETIRSGLVRIFISKGFNNAEDLADETINRVMLRLPDIRKGYEGEPARYFHGVARNIIRESRRRKEIAMEVKGVQPQVPPLDARDEHDCLGHCLQLLSSSKRDLILSYYLYDGHDKVEHHKQMAGELNITKGAYRSRAHQIRLSLEKCMRECPLRQKNLCPHKR